jgi:hypothetical protein
MLDPTVLLLEQIKVVIILVLCGRSPKPNLYPPPLRLENFSHPCLKAEVRKIDKRVIKAKKVKGTAKLTKKVEAVA